MDRSLRALLVIAAALAVLSSATTALGQSEAEVERARRDAESAAASTRQARQETLNRETALVDAVHRYQELTARLSDLGFQIADLIDGTKQAESELRRRRDRARHLATSAYLAAASSAPLPGWTRATNLGEVAFGVEVRSRATTIPDDVVDDLAAARVALAESRNRLETLRQGHARVREEAQAMLPGLLQLVNAARVDEAFALGEEAAALDRFRLANEELEAALRSVSPRALRWRPLVERHFPEGVSWAALQVLDCESRGNPDAVNAESGATGLFQFLEGTWLFSSAGAGHRGADRTDPEANVASAAWLVARSEALSHPRGVWGHWECQPNAQQSTDTDE